MLQLMGVPMKLYPAFNNKNLNLYNFLTGGEKKSRGEAVKSLSVAMDLFVRLKETFQIPILTFKCCITFYL